MDPAGIEFRNTRDMLKQYCYEMHMPEDLKLRLLEYAHECKATIRQRYYISMMEILSPSLRGEVAEVTHGGAMRHAIVLPGTGSRLHSA